MSGSRGGGRFFKLISEINYLGPRGISGVIQYSGQPHTKFHLFLEGSLWIKYFARRRKIDPVGAREGSSISNVHVVAGGPREGRYYDRGRSTVLRRVPGSEDLEGRRGSG